MFNLNIISLVTSFTLLTLTMSVTPPPVTLDTKSILAIAQAMNPIIDQKFTLLKQDLANSMSKFDENIMKGVEETIAPLVTRQKALETKSDERLTIIENKVNELSQALNANQSYPKVHPIHLLPASRPSPAPADSSDKPSDPNLAAYTSIISHAKSIVGFYPVTPQHLRNVTANNREEALKILAVEFLREELNVKESELGDHEIVKVFTPFKKDQDFAHIYVQFNKSVDASWCLHLGRTVLRDKESKVFLYVPRQFFARFKVLDDLAFKKRREGFKTRIEFSETDIILLITPRGQYQFTPVTVPGLPPVDLNPIRTPPKGRKPLKRLRSPTSSPNNGSPKKVDRKSPPMACDGGTEQHVVCGAGADTTGDAPSVGNVSPDVGSFQSVEASTPGIGRILFNFEQRTLNNPRRMSLNS